jgi:transcriptional regulator with XRE-family HTH domain
MTSVSDASKPREGTVPAAAPLADLPPVPNAGPAPLVRGAARKRAAVASAVAQEPSLATQVAESTAVRAAAIRQATGTASASRTSGSLEPPRVGDAIRRLRQERQLSLDQLARVSGVSKSMLSQIERNLANPTVSVVWRLSNALQIGIEELLGGEAPAPAGVSLVHAHETPTIGSRDGQCRLRILGPLDLAGRFEWYELSIQPGGALESEPHEPGTREHLTVLHGSLEVQSGAALERARLGETARYAADVRHAIRNPGKTPASALLVMEMPRGGS